ncbi:hypothetical protein GQ53DRAFT_829829 [Thozetella sp. PMI_491]|nr:hypothetical protein GQ53DRAFT_829829 [Thozetella sp. PMI_491]
MANGRVYKDAPAREDRDELLANSDVESSPVDDDKEWTMAGYRASRRPAGQSIISRLKEYWWIYTTGLLVTIVGLQLAIWHDIRSRSIGSGSLSQVGGDYLNKGPLFDTNVVQWKADYDYVPLTAKEFLEPKVRTKWETLIPTGAAFVGSPTSDMVYNSTSVTHQLHCVYIMAKIFSAVLTHSPDIPEPESYEEHFLHCADYMRQAAMCNGDVTLEPRGENGQPGLVSLDNAFNGLHVCKDYSQVKNYLEKELRDGHRNILPLDD